MIVSRILHAGYLFEFEGVRIAFDPIFENPFSRNCYAFPAVEFDEAQIRALRLDAVFISHHHDDHCSMVSLDLLDRATPIYVYCPHDELFEMIRQLGFSDVRALHVDRAVRVGGFEVTPRLALDPDVDSIFHIAAGGVNVLNVVDAWIDPSALGVLERQAPWDLVLWPFQTMREIEALAPGWAHPADERIPSEWIEQLRRLAPRALVPSSCQFRFEEWSWLNRAWFPVSYARFAREIGEALPATRVVRLDPGESVRVGAGGVERVGGLSFVRRVGDEGVVDYSYDEGVVVPPTSEIAQRFEALTEEETQRVLEFCRVELPGRLAELEWSRRWKLTLFDHRGEAFVFDFGVGHGPVEWTTEVPISRLYGALVKGESLTSMYVRIDGPTPADPLEDPLVRALFEGEFGGYQRGQLRALFPDAT